ncbi:uncharacterized protein LOC102066356 [Zonotrichia albicollis]|uniref:uncharacterized protein LOC102066356 n=1 Tax=Zonotrichia albicollis TaxID=44394 RepID=UPI003D80B0FE
MVPGSPGTAAQGEAGGSSSRRGPARSEADGRYSPPRPQLISELPARPAACPRVCPPAGQWLRAAPPRPAPRAPPPPPPRLPRRRDTGAEAHHRAVRAPPAPCPPGRRREHKSPRAGQVAPVPRRRALPGPAARSPSSSGGLRPPRAALPLPLATKEAGWEAGWVKRPRHTGGGGVNVWDFLTKSAMRRILYDSTMARGKRKASSLPPSSDGPSELSCGYEVPCHLFPAGPPPPSRAALSLQLLRSVPSAAFLAPCPSVSGSREMKSTAINY